MTSLSVRAVSAALLTVVLIGPVGAQPATTNPARQLRRPLPSPARPQIRWTGTRGGPEAFAKAKAEGKPIFLSIGYSTCYWCHVAETTIYSDPAIAKLMNEWFVNVKVDREERPDVDRLYMDATTMLDGHGAWPNNLFLTPDGAPFYAGSYFPPKGRWRPAGFPEGARGDPRPLGQPSRRAGDAGGGRDDEGAARALARAAGRGRHAASGAARLAQYGGAGAAARSTTLSTAGSARRSPAPNSRRYPRWPCSPPTPGLTRTNPPPRP